MSLPPLPEAGPHPLNAFTEGQVRAYGKLCYLQGKADAVERLKAAGHWAAVDKLNAKGVSSIHTPEFAPYDPRDDLK